MALKDSTGKAKADNCKLWCRSVSCTDYKTSSVRSASRVSVRIFAPALYCARKCLAAVVVPIECDLVLLLGLLSV